MSRLSVIVLVFVCCSVGAVRGRRTFSGSARAARAGRGGELALRRQQGARPVPPSDRDVGVLWSRARH
jgi:hypothetical protein